MLAKGVYWERDEFPNRHEPGQLQDVRNRVDEQIRVKSQRCLKKDDIFGIRCHLSYIASHNSPACHFTPGRWVGT